MLEQECSQMLSSCEKFRTLETKKINGMETSKIENKVMHV